MASNDFLNVRVASKQMLSKDTALFELVAEGDQQLPPFSAGAHVEVLLPGGLQRTYSLCNPPQERHRYVLGVLRDAQSSGGSVAMHEQVHAGQRLRISAPRNQFALTPRATHSILLAGGIGITPLLSMAWQLSHEQVSFELHYCTRSAALAAFAPTLADPRLAPRVHLHTDDGPLDQRIDLSQVLGKAQPGAHVYVCGPQGFIEAVLQTATQASWRSEQLHKELFKAEPISTDGDTSFEIEIASTGQIVQVPANQTAVQALTAAGLDIPVSCEQGICGTCLTRVVSGTPLHRDQYLTDDEQAANDQFTPCCSRAKTARLVIDLSPI